MNRIILIGNGFDLAHGLDTRYSDFISWFWKKTFVKVNEDKDRNQNYSDRNIVIEELSFLLIVDSPYQLILEKLNNNRNVKFNIKNKFLEHISYVAYDNWVDIEEEYYKKLVINMGSISMVKKLNIEFASIQDELIEYLKEQQDKDINIINQIRDNIFNEFSIRDFTEEFIEKKVQVEYNDIEKDLKGLADDVIDIGELDKRKQRVLDVLVELGFNKISNVYKKKIRSLLFENHASSLFDLIPDQTLFLNFNYTSTEELYNKKGKTISPKTQPFSIHIHGDINEIAENPIIFGYGDELDENYRMIENKNDNECLENIKSIKYLEAENYKRVTTFINSESYQVCIFGHSCGLSDRTLLNTIFENKNCASIKPFYHKYEDREGNEKDNYSDIVRNISRCFNDKISMREKVVNKKYCKPLS